MSVEAG